MSYSSSTRQIRSAMILAVFLIVNTADGLVARIGDLFCVLGQFDLRNEFSGFLILNGSQLVYAAEGRTVFGGDQVGTDTPGVDGSALQLQGRDQGLIQVVGSGDDSIPGIRQRLTSSWLSWISKPGRHCLSGFRRR